MLDERNGLWLEAKGVKVVTHSPVESVDAATGVVADEALRDVVLATLEQARDLTKLLLLLSHQPERALTRERLDTPYPGTHRRLGAQLEEEGAAAERVAHRHFYVSRL